MKCPDCGEENCPGCHELGPDDHEDEGESKENQMTTHDFGDGLGPVPAHQHPNGGGWVAETAFVADDAYVGPEAVVFGQAQVLDGAMVYDEVKVRDLAFIAGSVEIYGWAAISGKAWIYGRLMRPV